MFLDLEKEEMTTQFSIETTTSLKINKQNETSMISNEVIDYQEDIAKETLPNFGVGQSLSNLVFIRRVRTVQCMSLDNSQRARGGEGRGQHYITLRLLTFKTNVPKPYTKNVRKLKYYFCLQQKCPTF